MIEREDIIRMAREAGFATEEWGDGSRHVCVFNFQDSETDVTKELERFAALVAAAAVEREREACAKVAENLPPVGPMRQLERATLKDCAAAIRARGKT